MAALSDRKCVSLESGAVPFSKIIPGPRRRECGWISARVCGPHECFCPAGHQWRACVPGLRGFALRRGEPRWELDCLRAVESFGPVQCLRFQGCLRPARGKVANLWPCGRGLHSRESVARDGISARVLFLEPRNAQARPANQAPECGQPAWPACILRRWQNPGAGLHAHFRATARVSLVEGSCHAASARPAPPCGMPLPSLP